MITAKLTQYWKFKKITILVIAEAIKDKRMLTVKNFTSLNLLKDCLKVKIVFKQKLYTADNR